jgi:hypothetical protein
MNVRISCEKAEEQAEKDLLAWQKALEKLGI